MKSFSEWLATGDVMKTDVCLAPFEEKTNLKTVLITTLGLLWEL